MILFHCGRGCVFLLASPYRKLRESFICELGSCHPSREAARGSEVVVNLGHTLE